MFCIHISIPHKILSILGIHTCARCGAHVAQAHRELLKPEFLPGEQSLKAEGIKLSAYAEDREDAVVSIMVISPSVNHRRVNNMGSMPYDVSVGGTRTEPLTPTPNPTHTPTPHPLAVAKTFRRSGPHLAPTWRQRRRFFFFFLRIPRGLKFRCYHLLR